MQVTLQHHQKIGKGVDCVRVHIHCILSVLFKICNAEGLDDPFHDLRLSGQGKFLKHNSHGLVQRLSSEIHLPDVVPPYLSCELIYITDQLPNIGGI